jgi:hypothetical protein
VFHFVADFLAVFARAGNWTHAHCCLLGLDLAKRRLKLRMLPDQTQPVRAGSPTATTFEPSCGVTFLTNHQVTRIQLEHQVSAKTANRLSV